MKEKRLLDFLQRKVIRFPAVAFLLVAMALTGLASYFSYLSETLKIRADQEIMSEQLSDAINDQIRVVITALVHTRSLFVADGGQVGRAEFGRFVGSMDLDAGYNGVLGIGYLERVVKPELNKHVESVRDLGHSTYVVWPKGTSSEIEFFPVVYIEPFDGSNQRVFGFNAQSDPDWREAMEKARDMDAAAMTGRVNLARDSETTVPNGPGFVLFLPVYKPGMPIATIEQRRMALMGYVFAPVRTRELFSQILADQNQSGQVFSFEVYDGPQVKPEMMIFAPFEKGVKLYNEGRVSTLHLKAANHTWTVTLRPLATDSKRTHWLVLILGSLVSGIIYLFARLASQYAASVAKSERQMRLVADGLPVLMAYVGVNHRYKFVNRAYSEWSGGRSEDLVETHVADFWGSEYENYYRPLLNRALRGENITFVRGVQHHLIGERICQGQFIPDIRSNGKVAGVMVLITDITEQRGYEDRLKDERRVSELVSEVGLSLRAELRPEQLTQKVVDIATELISARFGAFFYNVTGKDSESYMLYNIAGVGKEKFSQFPMPRNTQIFAPTFNGERIVRLDDVTKHPDFGQNQPYQGMPDGHLPVRSYLAAPVVSRSGEVLGGLFFGHPDAAVFNERAERLVEGLAAQAAVAMDNAKLYAEAQAANRIKDEFLATLSHELRTPLNVVLGYAELLREEPGAEGCDAYIDAIYRNAKAQGQIIADLLDISAIITGKLSFQPVRVNAREVATAAVENVRFAAESKGVILEADLTEQDCWLMSDPTRLQQIVWNLMSNAVKFTPKGGKVKVRVVHTGGHCVIEIIDTGIGIAQEFLPYVFERFRQEDSGRARKFGGLGLGLSIVKQLVELHGGEIEVVSDGKSKGAIFTVRLPAICEQSVGEQPTHINRDRGPRSGSNSDTNPGRDEAQM